MDPKDLIEKLGLEPLPGEGGFFKETYRSSGQIEITGEIGDMTRKASFRDRVPGFR